MASAAPRAGGGDTATLAVAVVRGLGEGLSRLWRQSLAHSYLYRKLHRIWRERFTSRGRFVFLLCVLVGIAGVDTRQALVYQLFAFVFGPLAVAALLVPRRPPSARLVGGLPRRVTAGRSVVVSVGVETEGPRSTGNLVVSWPGSGEGLVVDPLDAFTEATPGRRSRSDCRWGPPSGDGTWSRGSV